MNSDKTGSPCFKTEAQPGRTSTEIKKTLFTTLGDETKTHEKIDSKSIFEDP